MVENKKYSEYPRILVISNNAFSCTSNNGKTLASFFKKLPKEKVAQLYFSSEIPNDSYYDNFFRVTDNEVVKSVFLKKYYCGEKINIYKSKPTEMKQKKIINKLKDYSISRIIRELFWSKRTWNNKKFNEWIDEFNPQIIFLCAGDSGFAYDITRYIRNKFHTKLVVYITDDYVLPRKTVSIFWWLRRKFILKKMHNTIKESNLFVTISEQMQITYKELFGVDSILAVNMTKSLKGDYKSIQKSNIKTLVYTGGIHYNRYKTLNLLAQSLKSYNSDINNKNKVYLKIYSTQQPSRSILKYLNVKGGSEFCGKLDSNQVKEVLNKCDIPVHVESFDKKSIESTRLSISTKIPEYLSLGKPILAIGPKQVASMQYLNDSAYCIVDSNKLEEELKKILNNENLQKKLSVKALEKYKNNHDTEKVSKLLMSKIISIYEGKLI